jgi:hypothetical protein
MASLDLLHIPTPWHNSVVQLDDSDIFLIAKAKQARAALATERMTGGLVKTEGGGAFFKLERRIPSSDVMEPEPAQKQKQELEEEDGDIIAVTVAVTVSEKAKEQKRNTLSGKADPVVTTVVRRTNTGGWSATAPELLRPHTWLGCLRRILSLFWPKGL